MKYSMPGIKKRHSRNMKKEVSATVQSGGGHFFSVCCQSWCAVKYDYGRGFTALWMGSAVRLQCSRRVAAL